MPTNLQSQDFSDKNIKFKATGVTSITCIVCQLVDGHNSTMTHFTSVHYHRTIIIIYICSHMASSNSKWNAVADWSL